MNKNLYALLLLLATSITANAQFSYDFSTRQGTYQELTAGISVNDTNRWDDDYFRIPIGFNYILGGQTITHISTDGTFFATDSSGTISGFLVTDIDVHDKGNAGGTSTQSPISYQVTGNTPNRIFKFEVKNAGMYDEYDIYTTNTDFMNYQVWLYEADNAFEIHFGTSQITYPADYYYLSGYQLTGFMKNISMTTGNIDNFYFLQGLANAPIIDSASNLLFISGGLNTFPSNGTVYRFAPIPVSAHNIKKGDVQVSILSNTSHNNITVNNNSNRTTTYNIMNINGAQMNINGTLSKGVNNVDISNLASGMYMLHVHNNEGQKMFKIIRL